MFAQTSGSSSELLKTTKTPHESHADAPFDHQNRLHGHSFDRTPQLRFNIRSKAALWPHPLFPSLLLLSALLLFSGRQLLLIGWILLKTDLFSRIVVLPATSTFTSLQLLKVNARCRQQLSFGPCSEARAEHRLKEHNMPLIK